MLPMNAAFANVFRILPPGDLLATCPPTHTRPSVAPSRTRLGFHLQRGEGGVRKVSLRFPYSGTLLIPYCQFPYKKL